MSVCRVQMSLVRIAPIRLKVRKILLIMIGRWLNTEITRKMPYPPNFRRRPAKIMDPATGAST